MVLRFSGEIGFVDWGIVTQILTLRDGFRGAGSTTVSVSVAVAGDGLESCGGFATMEQVDERGVFIHKGVR
jgi:hypothetical protein